MFKVIALLTKKAGISREAFIRYYADNHAPLILGISPEVIHYERNFLNMEGAIFAPGTPSPDFDVVTTLGFADRASYENAMAKFQSPENARKIADDEANFLDSSKTRFIVVDVQTSIA